MKKLKLQIQVSADGFCGGPNGELDWMIWNWDDKLKEFALTLNNSVDSILLGRKMSEGFIPYWEAAVKDPNHAERDFAELMVNYHKTVFSKTLDKVSGINVSLAKGDLKQEVQALKQQPGKDIIVYGGSDFVSNLAKENLIDEYYLFVNPTAIGNGLPVFKERKQLELVKSISFPCGIVMNQYKPA